MARSPGSRGSGPVRKHPTDADIEELMREAVHDWRFFTRPTLRRIIRAMDLMVLHQRRSFELMSQEELLRKAALQQGTIYAFKLVGNIAQAVLDENPAGAADLAALPDEE